MVLKYVVREAVWPALWMGVANVIANALVMLRYVLLRVRSMCYANANVSQLCHPVGEPEYGGRLHVQPGFVRMKSAHMCSYLLRVYFEITCYLVSKPEIFT